MLDGVPNFRDLGGLPVLKDQTTRSGVVYRSAAPGSISEAGLTALADSTIGVIADLRADQERHSLPTRLPDSRPIQTEDLPIQAGSLSREALTQTPTDPIMADLQAMFAGGQIPSLGQVYPIMLRQGMRQFATVASLTSRAAASGGSILVHCTAGKDRTGLACALMLDAIAVDRDAIIDNYTQSETYLAGAWADAMLTRLGAVGVPLDPAIVALVTTSPADAIKSGLDWVDRNYGGSEEYLLAGGLSRRDLDGLWEALIGPLC